MTIPRHLFAVVVLSSLLTNACYESPEPLGKPGKTPLDLRLSGEWLCKSPREAEKPYEATLLVIPFDDKQYFAEWRDGDDVSRYRAYPTPIGRERILNVEEVPVHANNTGWIFMRYRFADDRSLRLSVVSEDALGELKGKAALQAIVRRVADDSLYGTFAVCTKANP